MSANILNLDQVRLQPIAELVPGAPPGYGGATGEIAQRIGARKLGYNLTVVPPGQRAWPFHNHRVNEEMFYVIAGDGELRIGAARHPIRAGDVIACPPGGPETAHQIVNTGSVELRYLGVGTCEWPEIVEYPDSGKFGVRAEFEGKAGRLQVFRYRGRPETSLDYWDGE